MVSFIMWLYFYHLRIIYVGCQYYKDAKYRSKYFGLLTLYQLMKYNFCYKIILVQIH